MGGLKYWDGTKWAPFVAAGARGVQGPQIGSVPSGTASGGLTGSYPNPSVRREAAGGLLEVKRIRGENEAYRAMSGSSGDLTVDAAGTKRLELTTGPWSQAVWWDLTAHVSILSKLDAAYHYAYIGLWMATVDADGLRSHWVIGTGHASVQTYEWREVTRLLKLNSGVSYNCRTMWSTGGGSWQFYQGATHLWMEGSVYPV